MSDSSTKSRTSKNASPGAAVPQLAVAVRHFLKDRQVRREEFRKAAEVSMALIVALNSWAENSKRPKFFDDLMKSNPTANEKRGKAQSLAKIYRYLAREKSRNLPESLAEALKGFGLTLVAEEKADGAAESRRAVQLHEPDPVNRILLNRSAKNRLLSALERAQVQRSVHHLRITVVDTPPFNVCNREIASNSESVGRRLAKAWLGSIDPLHSKLTFTDPGEVVGSMRDLVSESPNTDVVVGWFETGYRRIMGAEFVSLPGLANGLGAVVPAKALAQLLQLARETGTMWSLLLSQSDILFGRGIQLITVEEEAGDLFCQGPCGIDPQMHQKEFVRVSPKDKQLRRTLVDRYVSAIARGSLPLFVGGRAYCNDLVDFLGSLQANTSGAAARGDNRPIAFTARNREDSQDRFFQESLRTAPTYRIGAAVSRSEAEFHRYMRQALVDDVILNSTALAGQLYAEMLLATPELMIVPCEGDLPTTHRRRLHGHVLSATETIHRGLLVGHPLKKLAGERVDTLKSVGPAWDREPTPTNSQSG